MIEQAGLSAVEHPRMTAEQSSATDKILTSSDQRLHPASRTIQRQGLSTVTQSISSHIWMI